MKCHTCHGFAHLSFQCPSKSVAMAEKGSSKISPKVARSPNKLTLKKTLFNPLMLTQKVNFDDLDLDDE